MHTARDAGSGMRGRVMKMSVARAGCAVVCMASMCIAGGAQPGASGAGAAPLTKFKDASQPPDVRVKDLISHMTLEEKAGQVGHTAPAIPRLGIPEYNWWN